MNRKLGFVLLMVLAVIAAMGITLPRDNAASGQQSDQQKEMVIPTVTYSADNVPVSAVSANKPEEGVATKKPGFEAGLAIAGLLAVAFLVLRQGK